MSDFYIGYKKLNIDPSEIVVAVKIPRVAKNEEVKLYKVSVRKDLDISAVTFAGVIERSGGKIKKARIALGGVGATVLRLKAAEDLLRDADFNEKTFRDVSLVAPTMISPLSDLRASKEYRLKLASNFFMKFYNDLNAGVNQ
jgi:xanthine dehydrogenase small subunit